MNKKRLYKSSGKLHERGKRVSREVSPKIKAIFEEYSHFNPRDIELIILALSTTYANVYVYRDPASTENPVSLPHDTI